VDVRRRTGLPQRGNVLQPKVAPNGFGATLGNRIKIAINPNGGCAQSHRTIPRPDWALLSRRLRLPSAADYDSSSVVFGATHDHRL
jgi:hypothetical protein